MNTLTKLALGLLGKLQGKPPSGEVLGEMTLPPAQTSGGLPLMQALQQRHSSREFSPEALAPQQLSDLLWAAAGINRAADGGRTAPSAMNAQEIDLYAALPQGLYRYEPKKHVLQLMKAEDVRRVTGQGLLRLFLQVRTCLEPRQSRRATTPRQAAWARSATTSGAVVSAFPPGCDQKGHAGCCLALPEGGSGCDQAPTAWPF